MKENLATQLGLIAAGHLALHSDEGYVRAKTIAKEYGVPLPYLLRTMEQMAKENVLRSKRGPRGGFRLARPAKEISVIEIIESAEGPTAYRGLSDLQGKGPFGPSFEEVLTRASEKAASVLSRANLGQMIGK